jgi:hypothetical protein
MLVGADDVQVGKVRLESGPFVMGCYGVEVYAGGRKEGESMSGCGGEQAGEETRPVNVQSFILST